MSKPHTPPVMLVVSLPDHPRIDVPIRDSRFRDIPLLTIEPSTTYEPWSAVLDRLLGPPRDILTATTKDTPDER